MTWAKKLFAAQLLLFFCFNPAFAFSFAVFGDNHADKNVITEIFSRIKADPSIAFAVNVGDAVNYGDPEEYKSYVDFISKSGVKVYNVMGNHDAVRGGYKLFDQYFGWEYYSFDCENAHFIVLNNSFKESFGQDQYDFLVKDLEENKSKVIFVFFHRPTSDPSKVYKDYFISDRKTAEKMMALFEKYKVRYVITGHIHAYLKAQRNGVTYIVTGGAGGVLHLPAFLGGYYHFIKITVDGERVKEEVTRLYE